MRLLALCALSVVFVGCGSASLPPLKVVKPTFSYVQHGYDDAAYATRESNPARDQAIAIVSE